MLGGIFQGFLQIVFRVWTIGVFYFLNNRLFSWLKDSRTPRVKYHQIPKHRKDKENFMSDQDCKICLFTSRNNSLNNLMFMNFVHSRNLLHNCQRTVMFEKKQFDPGMDHSKEIISSLNSLSSFEKLKSPTLYHSLHPIVRRDKNFFAADLKDKENFMESLYWQESYSSNPVTFHCLTSDYDFVNPTVYKRYPCESTMEKENYFPTSGLDKVPYFYPNAHVMDATNHQHLLCDSFTQNIYNVVNYLDKQQPCLQEDLYFIHPDISKGNNCENSIQGSPKDKDTMETFNQVFSCSQYVVEMSKSVTKGNDLHCAELEGNEEDVECCSHDEYFPPLHNSHSSEPSMLKTFLNCKETLKQCINHSKANLQKEECFIPKEAHCSSAASIDSGFQSFHSINTTYTCFDIDGVTLYISDISYNKRGQVVAMTVGLGVMEDLSEESVFSVDDEEEEDSDSDDDHESGEDDDIFSDSDEDFIVFDTDQCDSTEHYCANSMDNITLAVNLDPGCPSFEVKISPSYSSTPYIRTVHVDELPQIAKSKTNHQVNSDVGFIVQNAHVQLDEISRAKCPIELKSDQYYSVENVKELNKAGLKKEKQVFGKDFESQKNYEKIGFNDIGNDIEDNEGKRNSSAGAAFVHKKKVQFESDVKVHRIVMWEYAYRQARLGPWKDLATNRAHFKRRIQEVADVVEPVLVKKLTVMDSK